MKKLLMKILMDIYVLIKKFNVKMNCVKNNYLEKTFKIIKKFVHLKKLNVNFVKNIFF